MDNNNESSGTFPASASIGTAECPRRSRWSMETRLCFIFFSALKTVIFVGITRTRESRCPNKYDRFLTVFLLFFFCASFFCLPSTRRVSRAFMNVCAPISSGVQSTCPCDIAAPLCVSREIIGDVFYPTVEFFFLKTNVFISPR